MPHLSVAEIEEINRTTAIASAILYAVGEHGRTFKDSADALVQALDKSGLEIVWRDEPCYEQDDTRLSVGSGATPLPSEPAPIYDLTPAALSVIEAFCAATPLTQEAVTIMGDSVELLIESDPDRYFQEAGSQTLSIDPYAQAVRDVVRANELLAGAVAVLGHEAVDTLMRALPDPVLRDAA